MHFFIDESKNRIKKAILDFPGLTLPCRRQSGKTTALLEIIHEQHQGEAILVVPNWNAADHTKHMYAKKYQGSPLPVIIYSLNQLRGEKLLPVYFDEFWYCRREIVDALEDSFRVLARLGTRS